MPVSNQFLSKNTIPTMPIALYSSEQLYAIEQAWFAQGNSSFALMQQAAWQMVQQIELLYEDKYLSKHVSDKRVVSRSNISQRRASIWVGKGNNGGDGWLIAYYLQRKGWQVQVTTVGFEKHNFFIKDNLEASDAARALQLALSTNCEYHCFENSDNNVDNTIDRALPAEIYIDAIFGIGFDRASSHIYQQAICAFNEAAEYVKALVIAVDIPSGLVASTGQVFDRIAIVADVTLCLIARKFGLHTKAGLDYSGAVIDIPLIPYV